MNVFSLFYEAVEFLVLVDRFGLVEDYGVANRDMAIETLEGKRQSELSRDGALTISVEGSNPTLAADPWPMRLPRNSMP